VLFSTSALGLVGASAGLGGDMVYRRSVGVNHAPPATAPEAWTAALPLNEIAEYEARRVEIDGAPVLLYRDVEAVYAIGAVCTHAGGPLEQGTFDGNCVECPWHQSVFDLRDGRVVHGPATMGQPSYQARIRNGQIEVRLNPDEAPHLPAIGSEQAPASQEEQAREVGG
jgi:nitrite reductase/ring-hydroxylating ferredoxin subunit